MVWSCISSQGVGVIKILDQIIIKEVYLDILINELIASIKKFGFIRINSITNTIKTIILNINLIYVSPGY